ncbi:MAG: PEP-CTERM sorting domain-containing protein [Janthinobacterium lividum]
MRLTFFSLASLCLLSLSAHASVTYNLALNGTPFSGTGAITLATAPTSTGLSNYTAGQFSNLFFNIDGQTFSTATGGAVSAVQFLNGSFYDITFSQQLGNTPNRYSLQTTALFSFSYNNLQSGEIGTITSSLAPVSVTPEPSSFGLLATGMLGVAGVLRRRFI